MPDTDVLLVGGGLAAGNCARWLREEGFDGTVVLCGRELDPPYNRPPCSKGHLQGKEPREEVLFRPDEWWTEQHIDLRTRTSVTKLDAAAKVATLANREELSYDKALLATGSNVRRLSVEGADHDRIHYLRTLPNSDAIRSDVEDAERVVVVGGSYIGTEVAASLTLLGKRVTMVMLEDVVHERSFGTQAGRYFQGVLEQHGVTVIGGDELDRFEGPKGHVTHVHTKGGRSLECELVVIGAGAVPEVRLASAAGLPIGDRGGVRADSYLAVEGVADLWVAGDIAEYDSVVHGQVMRIEHWDVAFNQGKTAALNILGRQQQHDVVPYFFSDLADWTSLEYVGPALEWDTEIVRGSIDDGEFAIFYLSDGHVAGCLAVEASDALNEASRLLKDGVDVSGHHRQLADREADLSELA
jgi:3-phenylpropionate/trans-cinnamate dioxygenase ferredoxin reductase component